MPSPSSVDIADLMSRKRAWLLGLLGVIFIGLQAVAGPQFYDAADHSVARKWGWAVLVLLLLANLATGGGLLLRSRMRALINDEVSLRNRRIALSVGFWMASITGLGVFAALVLEAIELSALQAIHIVLTASIASALLAFSALELRAHHDA